MKEVKVRIRCSRFWIVAPLVLLLHTASLVRAQDNSDRQSVPKDISMKDLLQAHGQLLAEGTNMLPVGPMGLRTYRLEEVRLLEPLEQYIRGRRTRFESVFRLTITGESFPGNHTIWINDEPVSDPVTGINEIVTIIFDRSVLEDSATISVTGGLKDDLRTTLPERLQLPERLRAETRTADHHNVQLRHVRSSPWLNNRPGIEIKLTRNLPYPLLNASPVLQIGAEEVACGDNFDSSRQTLTCYLNAEAFARLKDGDTIRVKYGRGPTVPSYQRFGRLNKSLLDK